MRQLEWTGKNCQQAEVWAHPEKIGRGQQCHGLLEIHCILYIYAYRPWLLPLPSPQPVEDHFRTGGSVDKPSRWTGGGGGSGTFSGTKKSGENFGVLKRALFRG